MGSRILISAGEASGDLLAAELLAELRQMRPDVSAVGVGGDALRDEGMEVLAHAGDLAVVGLTEVVGKIPVILGALRRIKRCLRRGDVDLVVLVDFPDFNLRVASVAGALGIPVVYYVSPQVWAWRRGRLRTIARRADHMLTLLPFEPALYEAEGLAVTHVGHPLVDRVDAVAADRSADVVALLPGSRPSEVRALWPAFLDTASEVARQVESVRFVVARAPTVSRDLLNVPENLPVDVVDEPAAAVLKQARCALVASGTATLEAALCGTPHAVAYRVSGTTWVLGRMLVRGVRHAALSNLVAGADEGREAVAPEFLQHLDPEVMARPLVRWLADEGAWEETHTQLAEVRRRAGEPGAAARAAAAVDGIVARPPAKTPAVSTGQLLQVATLAVALLAIRVVLGALADLHPDEAYFWRWSQDLAWGYFDQPPMVAWLIAVSRAGLGDLLGDGTLAVRLPAALCSVGAMVLVYFTAREHVTHGRALAAAGLLLATPLVFVGGIVTTPDAPLSLAWAAFLYAATRAAAPRDGRRPPADRWLAPWVVLGAAAALGLLSKLTMLLAPLGLALWWLLRSRRWLVGPAVGLAVGLAALAPWLAWNLRHGFAPFVWEMSHGLNPQGGNPALRFAEFLGGQAGLVGPVLVVAAAVFWVRTLVRRDHPAAWLWTALSLPVLAAFGLASLSAPSAANWPAMAYPAVACGLVLTASWRTLIACLTTGGMLAAIATVHVIHPLPWVPARMDPLADTAGYGELADAVEYQVSLIQQEGIPSDDSLVLFSRYQDAAAVSFHYIHPHLIGDQPGRGRPNQWDLWPPPDRQVDLFVSLGPCADAPCDPVHTHEVVYRGEVVRRYVFYRCLPPVDEAPWNRPGTHIRESSRVSRVGARSCLPSGGSPLGW